MRASLLIYSHEFRLHTPFFSGFISFTSFRVRTKESVLHFGCSITTLEPKRPITHVYVFQYACETWAKGEKINKTKSIVEEETEKRNKTAQSPKIYLIWTLNHFATHIVKHWKSSLCNSLHFSIGCRSWSYKTLWRYIYRSRAVLKATKDVDKLLHYYFSSFFLSFNRIEYRLRNQSIPENIQCQQIAASQMAKIVINFNNLKVLEINYDIAHGAKTTEHPIAHNSK